MGTQPRAGAGRMRARARQRGAASAGRLAALATFATIVLLAVDVVPPEDRSPERATPIARTDAPPAVGADPDDPDPALAAEDERPALARAAEAGLRRMRVQFAQSMLPALPSADDVDAIAAAVAGARREAGPPAPADAPPVRRLTLPPPGPMTRLPPAEGSVTLVGESTLLIRSHGLTVLADPGFLRRGERARLGWGFAVPRRADPAIDFDELPQVDVVLVSRLREDRFDRIARRRLPRDVPIVAPREARAELVSMGFSAVHALPAWGSLRVTRGDASLTLTATPTRAGPPLLSALVPASMGTLLDFGGAGHGAPGPGYRIWISGDTSIDDALLAELGPRLVDVDLALLHVGGPTLAGLGGSMDGASGVEAARRLGARAAIPLRLADFGGAGSSPATVASTRAAADARGPRVRLLERGDVHRFAPVQHWARADEVSATR